MSKWALKPVDDITPSDLLLYEEKKYFVGAPAIAKIYVDSPEDEANAVLLKAAPELLEALKLILPMAKGWAALYPVGSNKEYILRAESVIDKAEGKP